MEEYVKIDIYINRIKRVIGIPEQNLEDELLRLISLGQSIVVC